jgi:hypothetical protein
VEALAPIPIIGGNYLMGIAALHPSYDMRLNVALKNPGSLV